MDLLICPTCRGEKVIVTKAKHGSFSYLCNKCQGEGVVHETKPVRNRIVGS